MISSSRFFFSQWPPLRRWGTVIHLVVVAWLSPFLTGCQSFRFYTQAIHGQCQIVHRRQPIARLLEKTNTPPKLAAQLRLILDIRQFAENDLGLPANGHYLSYADLGRPFAVWNVFAAPEFSLEAKSWWYPIVGRLKYQGYFDEAMARRYAAQLAAKGYDVHLGGVPAYSTLGWFRDPVLNTFVFDDEADLVELIVHELTHQRVFAPGDTDFNEALATAVAEEGVRRWIVARGQPDAIRKYRDEVQRREEFIALLERTRDRLQAVYTGSTNSGPVAENFLRAEKAKVLAGLQREFLELKAHWHGNTDHDAAFNQPWNNARLNTVETYYKWLPAFRHLMIRSDQHLDRFLAEAERLAGLSKEKRRQAMESLLRDAEPIGQIPRTPQTSGGSRNP